MGVQGGVLDETDIRSQVRILEDELKRHKVSISYTHTVQYIRFHL